MTYRERYAHCLFCPHWNLTHAETGYCRVCERRGPCGSDRIMRRLRWDLQAEMWVLAEEK